MDAGDLGDVSFDLDSCQIRHQKESSSGVGTDQQSYCDDEPVPGSQSFPHKFEAQTRRPPEGQLSFGIGRIIGMTENPKDNIEQILFLQLSVRDAIHGENAGPNI
jgi:hypothetical protein